MNSVIVIPARLASTRLPRKMLLAQTGKPLIQHTYEAAVQSKKAQRVIVATDCPSIFDVVTGFGGDALMTRVEHSCGTDRVAEVAEQLDGIEIILNVQGDEPELDPDSLDLAIELLEQQPDVAMSTLATPIWDEAKLLDPNCVKVVLDNRNHAIFFSRSPIPFARQGWNNWLTDDEHAKVAWKQACFWQHIGVYGYRRNYLLKIPSMNKSQLEQIESLEQLRILAQGDPIAVGKIQHAAPGIDTEADYRSFVSRTTNC